MSGTCLERQGCVRNDLPGMSPDAHGPRHSSLEPFLSGVRHPCANESDGRARTRTVLDGRRNRARGGGTRVGVRAGRWRDSHRRPAFHGLTRNLPDHRRDLRYRTTGRSAACFQRSCPADPDSYWQGGHGTDPVDTPMCGRARHVARALGLESVRGLERRRNGDRWPTLPRIDLPCACDVQRGCPHASATATRAARPLRWRHVSTRGGDV